MRLFVLAASFLVACASESTTTPVEQELESARVEVGDACDGASCSLVASDDATMSLSCSEAPRGLDGESLSCDRDGDRYVCEPACARTAARDCDCGFGRAFVCHADAEMPNECVQTGDLVCCL